MIPRGSRCRRFAAAALVAIGTSFQSCDEQPRFSPANEAFRDANARIETGDGLTSFGNSAEARELAARFVTFLGVIRDEHFATEGPVGTEPPLVFAQLDAGAACFLVHHPELSRFREESRSLLAQLAWEAARTVVGLRLGADGEVAVGLRGDGWFYGATAIGRLDGEPEIVTGSAVDSEVLFRFFRTPADATEPR